MISSERYEELMKDVTKHIDDSFEHEPGAREVSCFMWQLPDGQMVATAAIGVSRAVETDNELRDLMMTLRQIASRLDERTCDVFYMEGIA